MQTEPHVVIVGGGFSGAAVAIHLLRLAPVGVRVTLLE
ncbi:FAD/NAD(P)-binding protein, partial [Klebsiella michiganensis]